MIKVKMDICDLCGSCVAVCPVDCIEMEETILRIDQKICTNCLLCVKICPFGALEHVNKMELHNEEIL